MIQKHIGSSFGGGSKKDMLMETQETGCRGHMCLQGTRRKTRRAVRHYNASYLVRAHDNVDGHARVNERPKERPRRTRPRACIVLPAVLED